MVAEDLLTDLQGKECIDAIAQTETGGHLLVHFGQRIPYKGNQNANVYTSERGEWSLMVQCPWRIDGPEGVFSDWTTVAEGGFESNPPHKVLQGLFVESVELALSGMDLRIRFRRGVTLNVFCDLDGHTPECWYLLLPDESSIVAMRGQRVSLEPPEL